jgi:hypothetical protein
MSPPGLADAEAAGCGLRHELQFYPFALLFAGGEALPKFHLSPECFWAKEKARPGGRALFSISFNLYPYYIISQWVKGA